MKVDKKIIVLTALALISYTFLLKPQLTKRNMVMFPLRRKERVLRDCFSAREKLPTEDAVKKLKESNDKLKTDYGNMAGKVFHQSVTEDTLPFEKEKWPLYFRKTLYVTRAELIAEAGRRNARIPASFGFASNIPSEEEVLSLLNRLGLIREFVLIALNSGVSEITILKFLNEDSVPGRGVQGKSGQEQSLEQAGRGVKAGGRTMPAGYSTNMDTAFIREVPFIVKLSGDTEALFRLLYTLQKDYSFFLIKNIQVRKNRGNLTADLLLSALYEKVNIPSTPSLRGMKSRSNLMTGPEQAPQTYERTY